MISLDLSDFESTFMNTKAYKMASVMLKFISK